VDLESQFHFPFAPVAQRIEHAPSKRVVVGSNPAGRATNPGSQFFSLQNRTPLVDNQNISTLRKEKKMDLRGRIALITGASSGIGYATALRMAQAGADIAIGYERKEQPARVLAEHIRQMGRRAIPVHGDMRNPAEVLALVDATEAELGPIDILISNAGMGSRKRLEELTLEEWDQTMHVNLRPAFLLAQRVTPGMRERRWGRVIFVSSVAAFTGGIVGPHYAASKAGLLGLMHSLSASLAPHGVTVNAVAPALIADTEMLPGGPDAERDLVSRIPVGRLGKPEDVVEAMMMLVVNSYMTNQTILVDGGMYPR
jgi:3-oxoacyl-[acyl-carrier protein] reductase